MILSLSNAGRLGRRGGCGGRWLVPLAVAAATGAAAGPGASLAGASAGGASAAVATAEVDERPAEVRDYWTEERMRSARPVERRAGGAPAGPARAALGGGSDDDERGGGRGSKGAVQVLRSSAFPERTHGKVFFSVPGRGDFLCSGTVVRSPGRSAVVTGGHCVYDDQVDRFATNWMFVPGYREGERPFGEWFARKLATTPQFRSSGSLSHDVGVALVRRDRDGRGIQDRVGARRIAFGQPREQLYDTFGYPARPPFDGRYLYRCDSPYEGDDHRRDPPLPMRIDCDMTAGSSGGGWVTEEGLVTSVISYAYECPPGQLGRICENPEKGKLFGPYFGKAARALYRANRGQARRCRGLVATHRGGRGDNVLRGTNGRDVMHGGPGDDRILGRAGNDVICGGAGDDRIFGGRGNNRINTGPGRDRVFVRAPGRNRVWALRGANRVRCGPGRDRVVANHRTRVHRSCNVVVRR